MPQIVKVLNRFVVITFILCVIFSSLEAQKTASGVINDYYKVIGIGTNEVTVRASDDLSTLSRGDKVMMIQLTGDIPFLVDYFTDRQINELKSTGLTQFLSVKSVDEGTDKVTFSANIKSLADWDVTEKIQLVRLFEAVNAEITGDVTAQPWDGDVGGIVGMVVYETLELNANIDVSGQGFLGAPPVSYSPDTCDTQEDTLYFHYNTPNKAGLKGEGILTVNDSLLIGAGSNLNGGGGGNGLLAGGAGGGHFGNGRSGGVQDNNNCPTSTLKSSGGFKLDNIYDLDYRMIFGGGGGGTTEISGVTSTSGGNGGGIVVIIADSVIGNNRNIIADGGSVTEVATGGAGGGGAGGAIALAINGVTNNLNLSVRGGNGGDTDDSEGYCGGTGGGGGAGVVLSSLGSVPAYVVQDVSGGSRGNKPVACVRTSSSGASGGVIRTDLEVLLNGFIFNSIYGVDTICAGSYPNIIQGSLPTGGSGIFDYQWLKSTDSSNWTEITHPDSLTYQPEQLTQTTWFTRAIYDPVDTIYDTALAVKVYVYNAILNNLLSSGDTLCENTSPGTLSGGTLSGGNGIFTYKWETSLNQVLWDSITNTSSYTSGILDTTTYYRRIAYSAGVCVDTSNIDTLTVLKDISNNSFISLDTTICNNDIGGELLLTSPLGGDGQYRYTWIESTDNNSYSEFDQGTSPTYVLGNQTESKYYKRVVLSGSDDVCVDTTNQPRWIEVLDQISSTTLVSDSIKYCSGDVPLIIRGGVPTGGTGDYDYYWYERSMGGSWTEITEINTSDLNQATSLYDTVEYQRITYSGRFGACKDTSTIITISVIDSIVNNLETNDTALCEEGIPLPFSEQVASGGVGNIEYTWLLRSEGSGFWTEPSNNNLPTFSSTELISTTDFVRVAKSNICRDTSNKITVTIYPLIEQNEVIGGVDQYTCYNSPIELVGFSPTGGQTGVEYVYQWQSSTNNASWIDQVSTANFTTQSLTDSLYLRRIVISGDYQECIDTSEVVYVQINNLPTGDIISDLDTLCQGDTINIAYSFTGNGPWQVDLGDDVVLLTDSNVVQGSGMLAFPVDVSAEYSILRLEDDSTCQATLETNNGIVDLTVFEVPVAYAGEDAEVCGNIYQLNAVPSVGSGLWNASGVSFDNFANSNAISTSSELDRIYPIFWTETNWQCSDTDTVQVLYSKQPEKPFAGEDQELDYDFYTTLEADTTIYEGQWSFLVGMGELEDSSSNTSEVQFSDDTVGTYTLLWTVTNGACIPVYDTVIIDIKQVKLYGGFSPFNGDGFNDSYLIKLSKTEQGKITVMNHYGNIVKTIPSYFDETFNSYIIEWDGTNDKGKELPDGMYFILLERDGRDPVKKIVELRRSR